MYSTRAPHTTLTIPLHRAAARRANARAASRLHGRVQCWQKARVAGTRSRQAWVEAAARASLCLRRACVSGRWVLVCCQRGASRLQLSLPSRAVSSQSASQSTNEGRTDICPTRTLLSLHSLFIAALVDGMHDSYCRGTVCCRRVHQAVGGDRSRVGSSARRLDQHSKAAEAKPDVEDAIVWAGTPTRWRCRRRQALAEMVGSAREH